MKQLLLFITAIFLISGCWSSEENSERQACVYSTFKGDLHSIPLYKNSPKIALRGYDVDFGRFQKNFDQEQGITINREENCNQEIFLNEAQKDSLFRLLKGFNTYTPFTVDACYSPRHKFIFYDSRDSINGYIDICFSCGQSRSNLKEFRQVCQNQLDYYADFVKWCGITAGFPDAAP